VAKRKAQVGKLAGVVYSGSGAPGELQLPGAFGFDGHYVFVPLMRLQGTGDLVRRCDGGYGLIKIRRHKGQG